MKLPEPSEEKSKPKMDKQPKNFPQVVVRQAVAAHHPGDAYNKLTSLFKRKSASHQAEMNQSQAVLRSKPASIVNPEPESRSRTESMPAGPVRSSGQGVPHRSGPSVKGVNPDLRLRAFVSATKNAPPAKAPTKYRLRPNRELTRRAYWDVAATFSLIVNAILVGALLVMAGQIRNLKTMTNGLLGGLYSNFVEMDKASITTTISVAAQIPISFNLPIQQDTNVTLTASVPVAGAWVVINSGGLSINAPANVTLPAGTNLPIALNLSVPVQATVPISLQVPVNIPLNQTDLHAPFTGLQQTIRPLYCTFNKNVQYPEGVFICAGHDIPTPGTP
jgi:hypothetical protein